jgi:hypothetical protein
MPEILDDDTKKVANKQVQKWYKDCGIISVILTFFSALFCQTMYSENQQLRADIIKERAESSSIIRENTNFIQSLLQHK